MIFCKELDKNFETKEELFKELKANKKLLIAEKKAKVYKSIDKGISLVSNQEGFSKIVGAEKSEPFDSNYYYFVVNSSNVLDRHSDMHIKGNWNKTVKEQQGKVYLVFDHSLKRNDIIAMKENIEMFTAEIPFSLLGKNYEENTYCLIYKVRKDNIENEDAKKWLEKGYKLEASVRMQYTDIDIAIDSDKKGDEKEKANFDKYYPEIANKNEFDKIHYFWIVKQAKNVYESSLLLFGSNSSTGLIEEETKEENTKEAVTDTSNPEPSTKDTQKIPNHLLI